MASILLWTNRTSFWGAKGVNEQTRSSPYKDTNPIKDPPSWPHLNQTTSPNSIPSTITLVFFRGTQTTHQKICISLSWKRHFCTQIFVYLQHSLEMDIFIILCLLTIWLFCVLQIFSPHFCWSLIVFMDFLDIKISCYSSEKKIHIKKNTCRRIGAQLF